MSRVQISILTVAVLLLLLLFGLRGIWLQDMEAVEACRTGAQSLDCALRANLGIAMYFGVFGWSAVAFGVLAIAITHPLTAFVGAITAALGLALYNTDIAAVGAVFSLIAVARLRNRSGEEPSVAPVLRP